MSVRSTATSVVGIILSVGAVAVLFLFVVMMLDVDFAELRQGFLNYLPVGGLIAFIFLTELLLVLGAWVVGLGLFGLFLAWHLAQVRRYLPPGGSTDGGGET